MKIIFNINYRTKWGESVYIVGNCKELGDSNVYSAVKMEPESDERWNLMIDVPEDSSDIYYTYFVKDDTGKHRYEWGKHHEVVLGKGIETYELYDKWNDCPDNKVFYSSAFTDGIFYRKKDKQPQRPVAGGVVLRVFAPIVKSDEILVVTGDCDALGNWNPQKALPLNSYCFPEWEIVLDRKTLQDLSEYKFLIVKNNAQKTVVAWESCNNRVMDVNVPSNGVVSFAGIQFNDSRALWKGAGTAIPVFSLRSDADFGVGDFYDLFKIVDWAKATGQKIIQLLPINDTTMLHTWEDSYPYSAISSFALHPMYLRPDRVGTIKDKDKLAHYMAVSKELNSCSDVDYERVNSVKLAYLRDIYDENGAKTIKTVAFRSFLKSNIYWLKSYAAFCVLRDKFETPDFKQWGKYAEYSDAIVESVCVEYKNEINFIYYLQYHLDKQLREARNYAHDNGVVLKGDIPIGISRYSVDAWMYSDLFYMDCQAGAPPDDFSVLGQNWGFPTYNWDEMSKDGYSWWRNRFKKMAEYFDAYRIDHILGFFRIWQIPISAIHGLLGVFKPAMPFSVDELLSEYGFEIDEVVHIKPYISDDSLLELFGDYVEEAKAKFLTHLNNGLYELKTFVDTQRKVELYFSGKPENDKNNKLRDALYLLLDDVLFIEDDEQKGYYHPRISAQSTHIYRSLSEDERKNFDKLYYDFFYHRHNNFWYEQAMKKLPPLINCTDMLVCGEDLGMIPDCVASVMSKQKILSLEIQRMPKEPNREFGNPSVYPYLSVCTTSTHDMSGIRAWWEEDRGKTQRFYNYVLQQSGDAPQFAEPWICDKIVCEHLNSPAILTILPLQDWLSISGELRRVNPSEERINIPANSAHYWKYRMHITLDYLLEQELFNKSIKDRIDRSGR